MTQISSPEPENPCFCPLKTKAKSIVDCALTIVQDDLKWEEHFGFDAFELSLDSVIQLEPALKAVDDKHKIQRIGILRTHAKSMYDWHVDEFRLSCINLLISQDHHSHTLFGMQRNYANKVITELEYEPNTFYLFNNQIQHCVINLDRPRYLLSLYFEEEIPFIKLKEKLANLI
jgi:hypothetical protein